ncbi:DNA-binding response regulator, OmpR family, contains REC and winged-helix (wHTH) domain [Peptostreptococcaceae bacterium pGA-8]|nr:DNA-binding response regulator, OmpR family, contains REC and winged-helix (wHTH) domain [Peptostreptococcaceae bacterium pGA-8]
MRKERILIVDDDPDIRQVLSVLLNSEGYEVEQSENGELAIEKLAEDKSFDLVLLDIMMPGIDGIEVCKWIRKTSDIPVLFLTAKSQESDKVEAYGEGGDDYLVKPFSQTDLLLKVKSLLRRYNTYQQKIAKEVSVETLSDTVSVNTKKRIATKAGVRINLTDREFDILRYLMEHRGDVVANKELYEAVWGERYSSSAGNNIMVHVLNLRKKLEQDISNPTIIKTVWGKGYRID